MRRIVLLCALLLAGCTAFLPVAKAPTLPLTVEVLPAKSTQATGDTATLQVRFPFRTQALSWDTIKLDLTNDALLVAPLHREFAVSGSTLQGGYSNLRPGPGYALSVELFNGVTKVAKGTSGVFTLDRGIQTVTVSVQALPLTLAAGKGGRGAPEEGQFATETSIDAYYGFTVDSDGNLFLPAYYSYRVWMVPKTDGSYFGKAMLANHIYAVAGNGTHVYSGDGGAPNSAGLAAVEDVACDSAGNLFIGDYGSYRVRMIPKAPGTYYGISMEANKIYTIAGNAQGGWPVDGASATETAIPQPVSLTIDQQGNLFIPDQMYGLVWMMPKASGNYFGRDMEANHLYVIAGNGDPYGYSADGTDAMQASLCPLGIAIDGEGNLFYSDDMSMRVRMIPQTPGTYYGIGMEANKVYTVAGGGGDPGDGVPATAAWLYPPFKLAIDNHGNLFLPDRFSYRVKMVPRVGGTYFGQSMAEGKIYSIAGNGSSGPAAAGDALTTSFGNPPSVVYDPSGALYIFDLWDCRVWRLQG